MAIGKLGTICLAVWLVLFGICAFVSVAYSALILGVLAIATGVLIFAGV